MNKLIIVVLSLVMVSCIGCKDKVVEVPYEVIVEKIIEVVPEGSIVLTFDDGVCVDSWVEHKELLNAHNAKATFFVNHYSINDYTDQLLLLQADGFEIGHHGSYHKNSITFVEESGIDEYLRVEIDYSLDMMRADGLDVTTFAFPYGGHTDAIVDSLRDRFTKVRGYLSPKTDNLRLGTRSDGFFYQGIGIDSHILTDDVFVGMTRAKELKLDLVVVAHCIEREGLWQIDKEELELILEYAYEIDLQFKMFRDIK